MSKKSCKKGYYYCYTDEKCKKIPRGYIMGIGGYLRKEKGDDSDEETKNNGNGNGGNGNGNHSNGNGNGDGSSSDGGGEGGGGGVSEAWSTKYKKSIDCDNPKGFSQRAHCGNRQKVSEGKNGDHEVAMAQSQLKKSAENISKLRKGLGKKEKDIPAWMQAKITDTAHDTDAAAGYVDKMDEQYMTQQQKAERMAQKMVNQARGAAVRLDAAKKAAQDVKTTSGSVTVREEGLRDWFGKSKSKDGKGGWVNVVTGGTCASDEPGEGTPKCVSSSKRASMSKKERLSAARRKKKADPGQQKKSNAAKPTYVSTDKPKKKMKESYSNWREESKPIDEGAANVIRAGLAIGTGLAGLKLMQKAKEVGEKVKTRNQRMQDAINKARGVKEEVIAERDAWGTGPRDMIKMGGNGGLKSPQDLERERLQRLKNMKPGVKLDKAHYEPEGEMTEGLLDRIKSAGRDVAVRTGQTTGERVGRDKFGPLGGMIGRRRGGNTGGKAYDQATSGNVGGAINTVRDALKNSYEPEGEIVDEGKKDACYHKVKSRYSVWPSAYASGALVKCRKKGAKNWGNKTKKESYEISNWRDDFKGTEYESVDIIKAEPLQPTEGIGSNMLDEKKDMPANVKGIAKELDKAVEMHKNQAKRLRKAGISEDSLDEKCWKGYKKKGMKTMFGKRYPNCVKEDGFSDWRSDFNMQEDWQKSNRKDGVDGMSQKSVNAYKRENPGSKLKTAVTGDPKKGSKDAKRRSSYCSRSKGQMKMHNIDCSKTPDKKICKARRRWKC